MSGLGEVKKSIFLLREVVFNLWYDEKFIYVIVMFCLDNSLLFE